MTEQMQERLERLEGADNKLELLDAWLGSSGLDFERRKLREARHELTEITAQLREDYGQMARARDDAVEWLTYLRDAAVESPCCKEEKRMCELLSDEIRQGLPCIVGDAQLWVATKRLPLYKTIHQFTLDIWADRAAELEKELAVCERAIQFALGYNVHDVETAIRLAREEADDED